MLVKENYTEYISYIEIIWNTFLQKRKNLESIYRKLPKAVFQGDLNDSNIMLDDNLHFAGLIDFNLSGTETILNYAFCECFYYLEHEDMLSTLFDKNKMKQRDEYTKNNLSLVKKHYRFTPEEYTAYRAYYNVAAPFRWPYICFFMKTITSGKDEYLKSMLDWIYYQLTREDVSL